MFTLVLGEACLSGAGRDALAKAACSVLILSTPFLLTYLLTYIRFLWKNQRYEKLGNRRLVIPPYLVPGLGHAYAILFNAEKFLRPLQSRLHDTVISLSVPASSLCYVLPGEGVRSLFKGPRDLVPVPGIFDALTIFFGLEAVDYHVFDHDHISAFETRDEAGLTTSHPDASRRIMEHQRKDFIAFLNGENLRLVMDRFSSNFSQRLCPKNASVPNQDPVAIPDLYKFVRDTIFRAEVEALYGKHIFRLCPSFCEDFWAFYDAFPVVSRGSPRWMYPSQYRRRDRIIRSLSKWRDWCNSNSNNDDAEPGDAESDPIWGTRYVRNMVRRYEDLGFSDAGTSSVILGFLFVTTANTIPAACWMMLHALLDATLTSRLRHELDIKNDSKAASLDCTALSSAPLLNSVYRETLRLHVAGAIGRKSVGAGLRLHGDSFSTLPSGTTALSASWLGGLDGAIWNTGRTINGVKEHSLDSFWPERFLEYPDDPTSGPLRKSNLVMHNYTVSEKYVRDDSKAKLSNPSALRGHFFPFGGGAWRCPGETLAKNTILVSVFLILRDFDVEILDPADAAKARSHHRAMPFGSHAFDRETVSEWQASSAMVSASIARVAAAALAILPALAARKNIIIDTDIFSDCDDTGALLLAATSPDVNLLGVNVNYPSTYSVTATSAILAHYGLGDVPIGARRPMTDEPFFDTFAYDLGEYASKISYHYSGGSLPFGQAENASDAVTLYRKILAGADEPVTIVSIGFFENLSALLNSTADAISNLTGPALIASKVSELVVMGGEYPSGREFNFFGDNPSHTAHVVNNWKGRVVFCGTEVGSIVLSGAKLLAEGPVSDPVRQAYIYYNFYRPRQSWDPLTVLYAMQGLGDIFEYGNKYGRNFVHANGSNEWVYDRNVTNQHWLNLKVDNTTAAAALDKLYLEGAWSVVNGTSA
ncbi:hypothetical protein CTAM01_15389 [Colletotrichum tamarilloi]|uniref:Inosine/uridine-preferring nucleoside hydrolase domain-containing protein n=1 Tax=Colletotrichum tamarilloi TaxID=1209934 RepID=A0ABQ9QLH3_9PEZI|nr:uncharacterized protein CTAM01_15389 [Colletotrichum tamarilloi]KAK1476661.1 hypothetical protein CTAM01_15389 [Colletotrichum tamarilloi]